MSAVKRTIFVWLIVGTLLFAFAKTSSVEAQEASLSGEADRETYTHVVVKGDTLWDICDSLYGNPWVWPKVWQLNPHITNPHWIYPGTKLRVYYELPKSMAAASAPDEAIAGVEEATPAVPPTIQPTKAPTMVFADIDQVGFITPFVPKGLGVILGERRQRELIGAADNVYLELHKNADPEVGKRYFIFKTSDLIRHPVTERAVGYLNTILGVLEITEVSKQFAKATVRSSFKSIAPGNKLMAYKKRSEEIVLLDGTEPREGNIILSRGHTFLIGDRQIVYIDLGEKDDIKAGNRFQVFRTPEAEGLFTGDEAKLVLSVEPIGELLVLAVEPETAAAVVTFSLNEFMPGERIRLVLAN
jgi:hypothetical protein